MQSREKINNSKFYETSVILSDDEPISAREVAEALKKLNSHPQIPSPYATLREARAQFERDHILKTLIAHGWKIQEPAARLALSARFCGRR